jgi:hypothetical protein
MIHRVGVLVDVAFAADIDSLHVSAARHNASKQCERRHAQNTATLTTANWVSRDAIVRTS